MARIHLFPVGNGDTIFVEFDDGRLMLVDYCHRATGEDEGEPCIDLATTLRGMLEALGKDSIDVVVFTHSHDDHTAGAEDFFALDHADKYKGDGRISIAELWVSAGLVLATGLEGSARCIRQEARHRIVQGTGVRVFSSPDALEDLAGDLGVTGEGLDDLLVYAGQLAPGFSAADSDVEIFVHSPFSDNCEPGAEQEDTNGTSIVLHLTFMPTTSPTRVFLGADAEHEVWQQIVSVSEANGNHDRLDWDVFKTSHHCSYTALSESSGDGKTEPVDEVAALFDRASSGAILVASCNPIQSKGTPPHPEAAAYYESVKEACGGQFVVTMEHPSEESPEPVVIEIGGHGPSVVRSESSRWKGTAAVLGSRSSRYGHS